VTHVFGRSRPRDRGDAIPDVLMLLGMVQTYQTGTVHPVLVGMAVLVAIVQVWSLRSELREALFSAGR
jgi:uncharacterized membrane protein YqjE